MELATENIIICSSPRSGGNWLMQLLHDHGYAYGREYLSKDSRFFIKEVYKNNQIVMKVHPSEVGYDETVFNELINIVSPDRNPVFIWLERNNIDEQANSFEGARATGKWFEGSTRGLFPTSNASYSRIEAERSFWTDYFSKHSQYHKVVYEDLVNDTMPVLSKTLNYIKEML